ncbi:HAD family hydrolase [Nocardioides pacificus]
MGDEHQDRAAGAAVVYLDGTLVDSVYQHVLAWAQAFREVGVVVPLWRLHRAIGMGGDKLVEHVAGETVERAMGDQLREMHDRNFDELIERVQVLDGASELLSALRTRGLQLVLASSGAPEHTERLLAKIEDRDAFGEVVSGSEAEGTKPDPDLIQVAMERLGVRDAVVLGDAVWDIKAATTAGVRSVGLLTGGFSEAELREAGAVEVYEDARALLEALDGSVLRA